MHRPRADEPPRWECGRAIIDRLIGLLFDGIFEQPLWQGFLDALRAELGGVYASLIFRHAAPLLPSAVHLYSGEASPPLVEQLYREGLYKADPIPYHALIDGHVYSLADLYNFDDPRQREFRRLLLAPSGHNALRIMRIVEPSGTAIWLCVARRKGDFDESATPLLSKLGPFLRRALRSLVALERERFNAGVAEDAIHRLNFAWLSLDAAGRILDTDAPGARLLAGSNIVARGRSGQLVGGTPELTREIAAAIKALPQRSRPLALVLARDPWIDMLLVPAGPRAITGAATPAMIAYIHGDAWSSADRCEQLVDLFALSRSEARLALALSRGMRIAEAAAEIGLTVETARNYSKRIYAKTGARGQPDLIRFIHRSVLAIA